MLSIAVENQHETRLHKLNHSWRLAHELTYNSLKNDRIDRYQYWREVRDELVESIKKEYENFYRHQLAGKAQYRWMRYYK